MENKKLLGNCACCGDESDRLFSPPLISPPDWEKVRVTGADAWWRCPGEGYPGENLYDVITNAEGKFLKPYETPDDPICWECFNGHVSPRELVFVVNKPLQIKFNGWQSPEWVDGLANTASHEGNSKSTLQGSPATEAYIGEKREKHGFKN